MHLAMSAHKLYHGRHQIEVIVPLKMCTYLGYAASHKPLTVWTAKRARRHIEGSLARVFGGGGDLTPYLSILLLWVTE